MTTRGHGSRTRTARVAARLLAAFALVLSTAAPLHGLLHEHHEARAGAAVHEAAREAAHSATDCPLCTFAGSPALQLDLPSVGACATAALPAGLCAIVLASRENGAAPARGPPAPTC